MTNSKLMYLLIGVVGLLSVLWLTFTTAMPIHFYFLAVPLIILPSLLVITQALSGSQVKR